MVGVARFELATPASRRRCSTRLSYTPTGARAYIHFACGIQSLQHQPVASSAVTRYLPRPSTRSAGPLGRSLVGKAAVFGTEERRFEPSRPSHTFSPGRFQRIRVRRARRRVRTALRLQQIFVKSRFARCYRYQSALSFALRDNRLNGFRESGEN